MPNNQKIERKFLLLQSPIGSFFDVLSASLRKAGFATLKVNFNGGDKFFYSSGKSVDFEQSINEWADFVRNLVVTEKITDLIVYGDCRPIHKIAINELKKLGIRIHVLEEGYFRPFWITYEQDGVNFYSKLPRDATTYAQHEIQELPPEVVVKSPFKNMAWYVTQYYFATIFMLALGKFKGYKFHFDEGYHKSFWPWVPRLFTRAWNKFAAQKLQEEIIKSQYFLVPLQLCRDYQIKEHSDFSGMPQFIEYIITNFAKLAPKNVKLVIKNHPLDVSQISLRQITYNEAKKNAVADRVLFVDGGHLPTMLDNSLGVITINSTAGLQAIHHKAATLVLGRAFYTIDGLVSKQTLAEFFNNPQKPDMDLYKKFRNYVMVKTQINGGYYSKSAMQMAANSLTKKLQNEPV